MNQPTASSRAVTLVALATLGGCSLVPTSRGGTSPAAAPAAAPPAAETPHQARQREIRELGAGICARTAEAAGTTWPDATTHSRTARLKAFREIIAAAPRDQFIATTAPVTASYTESSTVFTRTIPAGEPLLLLSCTWKDLTGGREYSSARLLSVDGVVETSLNILALHDKPEVAATYDLQPAAFAFDPATVIGTPRDASASTIYAEGHPDDIATLPKLAPLHQQAGECALKATGACMAAQQEVEAGPWRADLEAAKAKACDDAVRRARPKCMRPADAKAYDKLIDQLWGLSRTREQAYLGGLVAKFK